MRFAIVPRFALAAMLGFLGFGFPLGFLGFHLAHSTCQRNFLPPDPAGFFAAEERFRLKHWHFEFAV